MASQNTFPPTPDGCTPVAHIINWFAELSNRRTHTVIAGAMGGGVVIHNAIPCMELESWGRITTNRPTAWEMSVLLAMDTAFVTEKSGKEGKGNKHQGIGDYCHGDEVENCRKTFGEQLERVCATCPN